MRRSGGSLGEEAKLYIKGRKINNRALGRTSKGQYIWLGFYLPKDISKAHKGNVRHGLPDCKEITVELRRRKFKKWRTIQWIIQW
jgi:hypothetical protein